jgi:hypothetical protein
MSEPKRNTALTRRAEEEDEAAEYIREVYDEEKGELVTVSEEEVARFRLVDKHVDMSFAVLCVALMVIRDDKLYRAAGAASFKAYVEDNKDFTPRTAHNYADLGRSYADFIGELPEDQRRGQALLEAVANDGKVEQAAQLPRSKQYELAKEDNRAIFEELVERGEVTMPDGQTSYSVEEVIEMSAREFPEMIEEAKMEADAYKARVQQLTEEKKRLEAEAEDRADTVEQAAEDLERAEALEARYEPKARHRAAKEQNLTDARQALMQFARSLTAADIQAEDAPELHTELLDMLVKAVRHVRDAVSTYDEALMESDHPDRMQWVMEATGIIGTQDPIPPKDGDSATDFSSLEGAGGDGQAAGGDPAPGEWAPAEFYQDDPHQSGYPQQADEQPAASGSSDDGTNDDERTDAPLHHQLDALEARGWTFELDGDEGSDERAVEAVHQEVGITTGEQPSLTEAINEAFRAEEQQADLDKHLPDVEGGAALQEAGWYVEPTLTGDYVLVHYHRGVRLDPKADLEAAVADAEAVEQGQPA